jgi:hypothetical protein
MSAASAFSALCKHLQAAGSIRMDGHLPNYPKFDFVKKGKAEITHYSLG